MKVEEGGGTYTSCYVYREASQRSDGSQSLLPHKQTVEWRGIKSRIDEVLHTHRALAVVVVVVGGGRKRFVAGESWMTGGLALQLSRAGGVKFERHTPRAQRSSSTR